MLQTKSLIEKRSRGPLGRLVAIVFWGFNLLMLLWLLSAIGVIGNQLDSAASDVQQTATTIGAGIGFSMILGVWLIGALVLGLVKFLTRGSIETYEIEI
ncbi:MAG: hypothetical protein H6842_08010 [Rhodospirillaceae bacterium]|nr:hypothetical protein [Rhodospirillaceae bacterium]